MSNREILNMPKCARTAMIVAAVACVVLSSSAPALAAPNAQAAAREILDTTGIRGGLIVHLGRGDGRLTAALRAGDRFLVHGLDSDPNDVKDARATIRDAGVYGPVWAEHFAGKVLPYTDNLVNLVVVDSKVSTSATLFEPSCVILEAAEAVVVALYLMTSSAVVWVVDAQDTTGVKTLELESN